MSRRILVVDDDALLRRSLSFNLEQAGYEVAAAGSAEDALSLARGERPDLVLLDIGLPGMDGLDALRILRDQMGVPVIFLTARRRELDQVLGLELGADDYVTKPFDVDVLLARIKTVLRRTSLPAVDPAEPPPLVVGDLTVDLAAHTVSLRGRAVELPPMEFELLHALAQAAGQVVSVEKLLSQVWRAEQRSQREQLYVHVRWLREKLEEDPSRPRRVLTVRGLGYKLQPQEN